jgi:hypothetical protein
VSEPGCDLCEAARLTTWHYEDETCWVADCEVCEVPMVVWRCHGAEPPAAALEHMLARLEEVASRLFAGRSYRLDRVMRQIPDHFHAHARDEGWWIRRLCGPARR